MFLFGIPCRLAVLALCLQSCHAAVIRDTNNPPQNPGPQCTKSLPRGVEAGKTSNITIRSNNIDRTYLINIPFSYQSQSSSPLILSYHGGNRDAQSQLELDLLTSPEFNTINAILVYPQGLDESWQGVPGTKANDTLFTSDMLASFTRDYCIDSSRIFATGKSDGAGFNNVLACDSVLSTQIAAFAPVSGAFYQSTLPCKPTTTNIQCVPGRDKIPFLEFHGGNDSTIDYFGGARKNACLPTIPYFMQSWAVRNGMSTLFTMNLTALDTVIYTYGTGTDTGLVTHVFDTNIGHDWPSTEPNADNSEPGHHVASFNASTAIIEFFQQFTLSSTAQNTAPLSIDGTAIIGTSAISS